MKQSPAFQRMIKARAGLIMAQPFYGTLALKLDLVEDPKCKTTWTDGRRLGFNPAAVIDAPLGQLEAIVAHHVMACALGHPWRREGRDEATWNEATDYAINADLQRDQFELPEGSLVDPRFDGQYSEAIYSTLMQEKPQPDEDGDGEGDESGDGDQSGGAGGQGDASAASEGESSPNDSGEGKGKGAPATGETRDAQDEDGGTLSEAEKTAAQEDWREAASQAAQIARGRGNAPGELERLMTQILQSVVDWREVVQNKIRSRAKDDYNWSKPSRRYASTGIYMPSLDNPTCGPIVFAIDMSGSITQAVVDQFISELMDVQATIRPELIVAMPFDTRVRETLVFHPGEDIQIKALAGGGTGFSDVPRVIDSLGLKPEILIYLTDLDSNDFGDEPEYPVVWVSTQLEQAPFGDVVRMIL